MSLRAHSAAGTASECAHRQISAHLRAMAAACAHALYRGSRRWIATRDALITASASIVCVDVMRRTLAPAIRGVVNETSALRGNSAEIASAAVTGVTLGMEGLVGAVPPPRRVRALAVKPKRDAIPTFRL